MQSLKGRMHFKGCKKLKTKKQAAIVVAVLFKLRIYSVKVWVHCLMNTTTALLQLLTALLEHFDHVQYVKKSDREEGMCNVFPLPGKCFEEGIRKYGNEINLPYT